MKQLVRDNQEGEILSDSEFISTALDQISTEALKLKEVNEADKLLDGFSDMLELMQEVLLKNNINPMNAFQHAMQRRSEEGTFQSKKAINKD